MEWAPHMDASLLLQAAAPFVALHCLDRRSAPGSDAPEAPARRGWSFPLLARSMSVGGWAISGWASLIACATILALCDLRRSRGCFTFASILITLHMRLRYCRTFMDKTPDCVTWTVAHAAVLLGCASGLAFVRAAGAAPLFFEEKDFHIAVYCFCALLYSQADNDELGSLDPTKWSLIEGKDGADCPCRVCYLHHAGDAGDGAAAMMERVKACITESGVALDAETPVHVKCFLAVGCASDLSQVCWPWEETEEIAEGTRLKVSDKTEVYRDKKCDERVKIVRRGDLLEAEGPPEQVGSNDFVIPVRGGGVIKLRCDAENTRVQLNKQQLREVQEFSDAFHKLCGIVLPLACASFFAWLWSGPVAAILSVLVALALCGAPPDRTIGDNRSAWKTFRMAIAKGKEVMHAATIIEINSRVAMRMEYNVRTDVLSGDTCQRIPAEGKHGNCSTIMTLYTGNRRVDHKFPKVIYQDIEATKYKLLDTFMHEDEFEVRLTKMFESMAVRGGGYSACPDPGSVNCMVYSTLPLLAMMPSNWNLWPCSWALPRFPTVELIQRVWQSRALGASGQTDQAFPWFAFCCWVPFALTHKFSAHGTSLTARLGTGTLGLTTRVFVGLSHVAQKLLRSGGAKQYSWLYKGKVEGMLAGLFMCAWLLNSGSHVLVQRTGLSALEVLQSRVQYSVLLVLATELLSRAVLCQFCCPGHRLQSCCFGSCAHRPRTRKRRGAPDGDGSPPRKKRRRAS